MDEKQFPTFFTPRQLERLRELAMRESSVKQDPETHNLAVKLGLYVSAANQAGENSQAA